jgi:catechol 2,3-dioxygenase-like lactoylglutathione lyase family enzyme
MKEERASQEILENKLLDDTPIILGAIPSFKINSYEEAVAHYVDWLGFHIDWEWRAEPGQPVIMSVSRDNLSLFLNEAGDGPTELELRVQVSNLQGLADEWNQRRPGSVEVFMEQPYEIPTAYVRDPFGNMLALQQPQTEADRNRRKVNADRVRDYLGGLQQAGSPRPTPQQIVDEVGGSLGVASEVLGDFRGWTL